MDIVVASAQQDVMCVGLCDFSFSCWYQAKVFLSRVRVVNSAPCFGRVELDMPD